MGTTQRVNKSLFRFYKDSWGLSPKVFLEAVPEDIAGYAELALPAD